MAAQTHSAELSRLDPRAAGRPWKPDAETPWSLKWVAHLYRRAAFCPSWDEITQALRAGPEATLDRLLRGGPGLEEFEELVDESSRGLAGGARVASLSEYQAV